MKWFSDNIAIRRGVLFFYIVTALAFATYYQIFYQKAGAFIVAAVLLAVCILYQIFFGNKLEEKEEEDETDYDQE